MSLNIPSIKIKRVFSFLHLPASFYLIVSFTLYAILISGIIWLFAMASAPEYFPTTKTYVNIPAGSSISKASEILANKNIIKNQSLFKIWTKYRYGRIKSGDYLFASPESMWTVADRLANGHDGLTPVKILIKEGKTRLQIAKILQKKMLRFNIDKFLLLTEGKEGYLFPNTYIIMPNTSEERIVEIMTDEFNDQVAPYQNDIEKSKMTLKEVITLASLVEREARNYHDRRMIAGVLLNRLKINMPLQVDVTWFYTHGKGTPGITMRDLTNKDNPYNTYVHKGLPPTPIGSPGISSIKAVLNPIKSKYLFYLADRKGKTYYSRTYEEHLKKRDLYIRGVSK